MALKSIVDTIVSAAMLLASVGVLLFVWQNSAAKTPPNPAVGPVPTEPVDLTSSATEGSAEAPLAVVVFSDFECPFCRSFAQTLLPPFRNEYVTTGKVILSFRHLPLKRHQSARPAAEAAMCAHEQGRFWTLHDAFFAQPSSLREIDKTASDIGLETTNFVSCKGSERPGRAVKADLDLARQLEIRATPTFLVGSNENGKAVRVTTRFTGAATYETFKQRLGFVQDGPGR